MNQPPRHTVYIISLIPSAADRVAIGAKRREWSHDTETQSDPYMILARPIDRRMLTFGRARYPPFPTLETTHNLIPLGDVHLLVVVNVPSAEARVAFAIGNTATVR